VLPAVIAEIRSLHGPHHPTRPHGGGGASGPDGVKVQSQKARTRGSTPGGRESAAAQAGLRESAALCVAGLAAEEIGPAAALQDPPRLVPAQSRAQLAAARSPRPATRRRPRSDATRRPAGAVMRPRQRGQQPGGAVGLGGGEAEAGTGVGTEVGTGVEGGGR
jgi:hypothetical protein